MEMFVQTQSFAVLLSPLFEKGDNNATKMESVITLEPASEPCTLALRKNRHAHQHHTHTNTHARTSATRTRISAPCTRRSAPSSHTDISATYTHKHQHHAHAHQHSALYKHLRTTAGENCKSNTEYYDSLYISKMYIYIFIFTHTHTQPSLPRPALK